jgi:hypothetical protein
MLACGDSPVRRASALEVLCVVPLTFSQGILQRSLSKKRVSSDDPAPLDPHIPHRTRRIAMCRAIAARERHTAFVGHRLGTRLKEKQA